MPFTETNRIEFKRELTGDLEKDVVAFLNAEGGQIHFGVCDDGSIMGISLASVVSRHQDLSFSQLKIYYEGHGKVLNQQFAKTLDLTLSDGKSNQLAYLFADTNSVSIRVAKWWGKDKLQLRENEDYGECSLVKAMQKVLDKFDIENITLARKRGMKTREEIRIVDVPSLRELIINAFAHNDYSNGDTPIFDIYSDRFEITSYGGLVSGMTIEEFFGGVSRPRNLEIMRIFKDMEYVERLGSGIPAIEKKYERGIFHFSNSVIRFVLPFTNVKDIARQAKSTSKNGMTTTSKPQDNRKTTTSKPQEKGMKTTSKGQEKAETIFSILATTPTASVSTIATKLSLSIKSVRRQIDKLKSAGRIRRIGPDKGGHWEIIK